MVKKEYCCDDMKITVKDYGHVTVKNLSGNKYYRWEGHALNYCPFCGDRLDKQALDYKGIVRRQVREFISGGIKLP